MSEGIRGLLDNQPLGNTQFIEKFYLHPLISGIMRNGNHPAYVPGRAFSTALMDLVTPHRHRPRLLSTTWWMA
ncbi:MAG: hypothetical protein WDO73_17980 [Ignavibacteriota bacterium]